VLGVNAMHDRRIISGSSPNTAAHHLWSSPSAADIFSASLYEDQRNVELTRMSLSADECEKAVAAVLRARRIFIVGFGSSG